MGKLRMFECMCVLVHTPNCSFCVGLTRKDENGCLVGRSSVRRRKEAYYAVKHISAPMYDGEEREEARCQNCDPKLDYVWDDDKPRPLNN